VSVETTTAPSAPAPSPADVQPTSNETLDRFLTGSVTVLPFVGLGLAGWQLWGDALQWHDLVVFFLVYSACVAAMTRKDFGVIRAVTLDAKYTNNYNERHPLIGALHTLAPFEGLTAIATIVANESGGTRLSDDDVGKYLEGRLSRRPTPVSDYIHDELRPMFRRPLPDDSDYSDVFDSVEVYLGMLATYEAQRAKEAGSYLHGAWYGSFTWRNRYGYGESIESRLGREAASPDWPGRKAGLLVGPSESVNKAIDDFVKSAKEIRSRSL